MTNPLLGWKPERMKSHAELQVQGRRLGKRPKHLKHDWQTKLQDKKLHATKQ